MKSIYTLIAAATLASLAGPAGARFHDGVDLWEPDGAAVPPAIAAGIDAVAMVIREAAVASHDGNVLTLGSSGPPHCEPGLQTHATPVAFHQQPRAPRPACTGFLIGPRRLATAGRCVDLDLDGSISQAEVDGFCADARIIFDFEMVGGQPAPLLEKNAFACVGAHGIQAWPGDDLVVLELDRDTGRDPLSMRDAVPGSIGAGSQLFSIGHPDGLPTKVDTNIRVRSRSGGVMTVDADVELGSAGAPVLDSAGVVVGMIVEHQDTTVFDAANGCVRYHRVPNASGAGVAVLEMARFPDALADSAEPNDTIAEARARPLPLRPPAVSAPNTSFSYRGDNHVVQSADEDWFVLSTFRDDIASITIEFEHAHSDLDLRVFDTDLNLLLASTSVTDNEGVVVIAPTLGHSPLLIQVFSYDGTSASYRLSVDVTPAGSPATCGGPDAVACAGGDVCVPRPELGGPMLPGDSLDLRHAPGICAAPAPSYRIPLPMASAHPYANNTDAGWELLLPTWVASGSLDVERLDLESGYDRLFGNAGGPSLTGSATFASLPLATEPVFRIAQAQRFAPRLVTDSSVTDFGVDIAAVLLDR